MTRQTPIVPHIAYFKYRVRAYELPALERMEVLYSTPCTVRGKREEMNNPEGKASLEEESLRIGETYCLPSEGYWVEMQARYVKFDQALMSLAVCLDSMGSYKQKVEEAENFKMLPAKLSPTVVKAHDIEPDRSFSSVWEQDQWIIPKVERVLIEKHTPKKIRYADSSITDQANHFICKDDEAWSTLERIYQAAIAQHQQWLDYLKGLGSYQDAGLDQRYKAKVSSLFG